MGPRRARQIRRGIKYRRIYDGWNADCTSTSALEQVRLWGEAWVRAATATEKAAWRRTATKQEAPNVGENT